MCGIVAYLGTGPDVELLAALAASAGRRGPDGSGWALHVDGEWTVKRDPSRPLAELDLPDGACRATVIVGHSRLATDDGTDPEGRCQPLAAGVDVFAAFNGRLPGVWPHGDGQELTELVRGHGPAAGVAAFLELAERTGAERQAIVVADRDRLTVGLRAGHYGAMPLYRLDRPDGTYLCSRDHPQASQFDVPGVTEIDRTGA